MKPLTLLFLLCACLSYATPAMAHALPERMTPASNATLSQPPAMVSIQFDSELEPLFSTLVVKDERGTKISAGSGEIMPGNPKLLTARLSTTAKGIYHVYWNVVSRDGHRARGDYTYVVK